MTTDIRRLLADLSDAETALLTRCFIAPCVAGGRVRTRLQGLVYTFHTQPTTRTGWGVFQPKNATTARWVADARPAQIAAYLQLFIPLRLHLIRPLAAHTWLAYPLNEADARQRLGRCTPLPVLFVEQGVALDTIIARWDGNSLWYEAHDRRADPLLADRLREDLAAGVTSTTLRRPALTPELRTAYALAESAAPSATPQTTLAAALATGGGQLCGYRDLGDYWQVDWTTGNGEHHCSAIAKDLTVLSAGICLDGTDQRFDLHSLVGVVEQRPGLS